MKPLVFLLFLAAEINSFPSISEAKYKDWPNKLVCTGKSLSVNITVPALRVVAGGFIPTPGAIIVNGKGFAMPTQLHIRNGTNLEVMRKDQFACWLTKLNTTMKGSCGTWSKGAGAALGTPVTCT